MEHPGRDEAEVYPPSEDTFLMEDALRMSREGAQVRVIVEVGSGSGYLSKLLRGLYPRAFVVSTDLNPKAAAETARCAGTLEGGGAANGDVLRTSLLDGIREGFVDMAVFNPPYLPSAPECLEGCGIDRSWAGGSGGREVIDQFIARTSAVPIIYLLLCSLNNEEEVAGLLSTQLSARSTRVLLRRNVEGEHLLVLRASAVPGGPCA